MTGRSTGTAAILVAMASAAAATPEAVEIGRFGDWRVLKGSDTTGPVCFAVTEPKETLPAGAKRDAVVLYISTWPKDGIKSEISVLLGYPAKRGGEASVTIGTTVFKLTLRDDKGYVMDPTQELKLLDAMKKGPKLLVQAISERGTTTKDTYSLAGFTQALQGMASACP